MGGLISSFGSFARCRAAPGLSVSTPCVEIRHCLRKLFCMPTIALGSKTLAALLSGRPPSWLDDQLVLSNHPC